MTGRSDGNLEADPSSLWANDTPSTGPSTELDKLLAAATDSSRTHGSAYNAETMVDELLASTWEPTDAAFDHSKGSSVVSFAQQTTSVNALQSVLTESIGRLVQHRKVVSNRIAELEQDSRRDICAQMEDLEERFTKVSSSAVLIGDKLSTLDDERSRVLETDELMEALLALNDPSSKLTKSSNRLFNILHDPNQLHEASRIIKKMSMFSSELSSPTITYAVAEIERLSQTTENNLLTEFSNEQEKGNSVGMRNCAESLIEYNDKEKVADRYVWNVLCDRLAKASGEPATSSLDPVEDLDALFTKILTICTEQFPVIGSVFPAAACDSIRELLVERLFNDPAFGILSFLDQFFKTRRCTEPSNPFAAGAEGLQAAADSGSTLSSSVQNNRDFEKDGGVLQLESSLAFFESLRELAEDETVPSKYAKAMDEAIEHCEVILKGSELRGELVTKVYTSFVASFGDEYLRKLVALTKEILQEQRLTPDSALQFFINTEALLKRINFLDEQFETLIAASLGDSPTQLTICQESKQKCLDKLESSISAGLQQALTVIEKAIGQILATNQGKGDFLGGQASMSLSSSKACQKCTEYLQPLVDVICRVLIEENCERFLIALARLFKELYLLHLRKFRFDPDGACMLLRDVSEYRQAFRSPSLPSAVNDIFDLLHEIANVFALPPENLGGFVNEGKLATLNKQTLHHIVKRRWDYKSNAEKIAASLKDAKDGKDEK
uniref:Uncharacterized protein n=1 Tax=Phytophthora ramorum TaxID=164328 RepID=H3GWN1_PHYRM